MKYCSYRKVMNNWTKTLTKVTFLKNETIKLKSIALKKKEKVKVIFLKFSFICNVLSIKSWGCSKSRLIKEKNKYQKHSGKESEVVK